MGRYSKLENIQDSTTGRIYVQSPIYPFYEENDTDIYIVTVEGDRFDKLSLQFYDTIDYWWGIAAVNDISHTDSLAIAPGTQLRIILDPEAYILAYNKVNNSI